MKSLIIIFKITEMKMMLKEILNMKKINYF